MIRFIFRHIVRAPAKSLLTVILALFFTLTLGILQNTAANLGAEIERIYDETIVNVEIRMDEGFRRSGRFAGDVVPMSVVQDILNLGIVREMYLEGGAAVFLARSPSVSDEFSWPDILVGVNELQHLTEDNDRFIGRDDSFNMAVQFASGMNEDNFVYAQNAAIPVIISQELMQNRELALGDNIYIIYYRPVLFRQGDWRHVPAVVIGVHDGEGLPNAARGGAVIPLPALESMLGDFTGFLAFRFSIEPAFNRELADISARIDDYLQWPLARYPWQEQLTADIWDQELRLGATPLQQHVVLLQMLFPVAVAVSVVIGAGLAMLTMLQSAKNAAILRVLGTPKPKARLVLWFGQTILYIIGGMIGLLITLTIGLRTDLIAVVVPYLAGAVVGVAAGVILITNRSPLDLLQVKE